MRPIFKQSKGLTLIGVLLAVGIMGFILTIGLPASWDFYQRYQFDSEVGTFISILESARNSAMVNLGESSHGVYIADNNFVVYQGSSYALRDVSRDQEFPRIGAITISGPSEIVFNVLSGRTVASTFTVNNAQKTIEIHVNSEGTIVY